MPLINGRQVGPIGFGLMGLTWRNTACPDERAFATMRKALEHGCNFWNGGEFYGPPENNSMTLLAKYFNEYPDDADKVVLSMKGAMSGFTPDSSPEGIRQSVGNIIEQLKGTKKIDTFEPARRDPKIPLSVTYEALEKDFINKGLVGGVSLSEVSAKTIHEAAKVRKIDSVEVELSLWTTDVLRNGVAAACHQYGIPIVAYSPLGGGILTGKIRKVEDLPAGDHKRDFPRFTPEAMEVNLKLVDAVTRLAREKGCTSAQLAINWVRSLSRRPGMPVIIPIPGATSPERVEENSKIVELTDAEMEEIDQILSEFEIVGGRYPDYAPIET
ncbi:hypothetical protein NM208_g871 [Fusarium decemcellulare]|uniref:Uncharacterized protein n=1 Tax=Fusarium decemcellulare TaxID=57161 RepID=A0ACC1SY89_9HYPO|nr:hypothetical protein NM208_g871 [Fusarium decemcellulare]